MDLKTLSAQFKQSIALRPSTLLILGTLFLVFYSSYFPSAKAAFVIAISLLFFYIGEKYSAKLKPTLVLNKEIIFYAGAGLILISLAALYFNFFTAGGIPLFNAALRRFLSGHLTYLSFLIVPGIIFIISSFAPDRKPQSVFERQREDARSKAKSTNRKPSYTKLKALFLIVFAAAMMALLGFRTEVLAAIIAGTLTAYYAEIFDLKELAVLALIALIAFGGLTFVRGASDSTERATATMAVFDTVVERTPMFFGLTNGFVQFADFIAVPTITPIYSGRVLISNILGGRVTSSSTATIFAPPFLDFGVLGLLIFAYFGFILGATYKAAREKKGIYIPLHALLLTFLLLGIETGIVDLIVWAYFGLATIFMVIAHNYK